VDAASPERSAPPDTPHPPAPPGRPSVLAFFLLLLALQVVAGGAAQRAHQVLGLAWSELFGFLLPAVAAATGANLDPTRFLLLTRRPTGAQLRLGMLTGLAGFAAASGLVGLWSRLLPADWVRAFDLAERFQGGPWYQAGLVLAATALAPACEEVAFRGYLQSALRLRLGERGALLLGAGLFAAMHLNPVSLPGLALLGALFGWLALRSGSIWPSVAAHAANNAVASLLALTSPPAPPEGGAPGAFPALALMAVGLGALPALTMAMRRATPDPAPAADAVGPIDARLPVGSFRPARLPRAQVVAIAAGWVTWAALAGWRAWRPTG